MLTNYHTHTTFCDGKNTAEEMVLYALENGYKAIGFSGHGYTPFDLRYCMKDMDSYISEIKRLKIKYKNFIQIYLGVEEDIYSMVERENFDYIIGSCHYFISDGEYYPIDSGYDYFKKCLDIFGGDIIALTHAYYKAFCSYIRLRKPDIVGHFDLITRFSEIESPDFFNNHDYLAISEKYIKDVAGEDVIFEVNTGAMARNLRSTPYPYENLLHILKKENSNIILSSDCHESEKMGYGFDEIKCFLKSIGFEYVYNIYNNEFNKEYI